MPVPIATPDGLHRDWVCPVARSGKHVLCEKPLGISPAEAEEMIRACADANVSPMVAHRVGCAPHNPTPRGLSGRASPARSRSSRRTTVRCRTQHLNGGTTTVSHAADLCRTIGTLSALRALRDGRRPVENVRVGVEHVGRRTLRRGPVDTCLQ
ncbi:Gfo/Idh/MocA family oxidoreductase [Caballeronia pedi]|uniref:Gfo/Idh/MocA family oxidoreductase n=1 Tax=Caballeronia pedi TaxID=1777141 RepID=UPI000B34CD53